MKLLQNFLKEFDIAEDEDYRIGTMKILTALNNKQKQYFIHKNKIIQIGFDNKPKISKECSDEFIEDFRQNLYYIQNGIEQTENVLFKHNVEITDDGRVLHTKSVILEF